MSKINFVPVDDTQILTLPEDPAGVDTDDVGFATYVKGDKTRRGEPVNALLLDIDTFLNPKGVPVVRLLFGITSGQGYDGLDVTGRTFACDKNLSENAAQYSSGDLAIMGLISLSDPHPTESLVERVCEPAEKAKLLCTKTYRVNVEESYFETKNGSKLQRRANGVSQPATKLGKAEMLAKLKESGFDGAVARYKAGNKPNPKLPSSPPPAQQTPPGKDPFVAPLSDPGAHDLGEL